MTAGASDQHVAMRSVFVDANPTLADLVESLRQPDDAGFVVNRRADIVPEELPAALAGAQVAVIDHTALPVAIAQRCAGLKHVVFLGTGARSYMDPEALAALGITVHTIKGYGDTAVAECTFALMWAAARGLATMDRGMRAGKWLRTDGIQLTGRTLGIVGYGGIGAEMARLARGCGLRVLAWNRSPRQIDGVEFVTAEDLLAQSDIVSLHLLLDDSTRGWLSRARIAQMRRGAILLNTARGALVDEAAMIEALRDGQLGHAGLDVFVEEPLPPDHPLTRLDNVTLSAHSAFRTGEANRNLIEAAFAHCRRIAREGR